jgi:hypothetical protein
MSSTSTRNAKLHLLYVFNYFIFRTFYKILHKKIEGSIIFYVICGKGHQTLVHITYAVKKSLCYVSIILFF